MRQRKFVSKPKADDNTQYKYTDIQNKIICAKDRSISIVKKRNEKCARNYTEEQRGGNVGVWLIEFQNHNDGIEQHGKEQ